MPDDTPQSRPDAPVVSHQGAVRREAILDAMARASRLRQFRRVAVRVAAASGSMAVLAWGAWAFLSPSPSAQPVPPTPVLVERTDPSAPKSVPPVSPTPVRVLAQFVPPSPGIADRLAAKPGMRTVVAHSLDDSELAGVLAEDGGLGFVRIRGRVYVLSNQPGVAEQSPETH